MLSISIQDMVVLDSRTHEFKHQGVEMEMAPLATFLLLISMTLCSTGLEVLVPEEEMFPSGDIMNLGSSYFSINR
jgi:hypothetical protein